MSDIVNVCVEESNLIDDQRKAYVLRDRVFQSWNDFLGSWIRKRGYVEDSTDHLEHRAERTKCLSSIFSIF